ncbi:MAG: hypothetical protein Q4A66_06250 [Eubacteriales bacterium]|nr:hypothetical protein [Eubacteriales bacterium]
MHNEKNILLVSIENLVPGRPLVYTYSYSCEGEGELHYCNSLLRTEAGAKYILSHHKIDEIIVIGSDATYSSEDQLESAALGRASDIYKPDIRSMSEYSLFRYRIAEYLQGIDLEEYDVLNHLSEENQQKLMALLADFQRELKLKEGRLRTDSFFDRLRREPALFEKLTSSITENRYPLVSWLKRYIYSQMTDALKMRALESNEDLRIRFIPTVTKNEDGSETQNINAIVNAIMGEGEEPVNLYVDMQGLNHSNGFGMMTVLSILNNEWMARLHLRKILGSVEDDSGFAQELCDDKENYEISTLLAGMNSFIQYGRTGIIRDFWDKQHIKNERIERLLNAMQYVDDGISLCNIPDLEYGIRELSYLLNTEKIDETPDTISSVFAILEDGIQRDYGPLLNYDEQGNLNMLELVKWAYRKKFFQQTLTIIESLAPRDIVRKGMLYYANDDQSRDEALIGFNADFWSLSKRDAYRFNDVDHYFIKTHGRSVVRSNGNQQKLHQDLAQLHIRTIKEDIPDMLRSYSLMKDYTLLEELLYSYYYIGTIRNQVSHVISDEIRYPGQRLISTQNENVRVLDESIHHFISVFEQAVEDIGDAELDVVTISSGELRAYTNSHRIFPNKGKN